MKSLLSIVTLVISGLFAEKGVAQDSEVNWVGFEQLEDSLRVNPKPVFLDFYTDWCVYCKKMDRRVFSDPEVIKLLNQHYYAVRFDAESRDTVVFGGRTFVNEQAPRKGGFHQLALYLAARHGEFSPPALLFFSADLYLRQRVFSYQSPQELKELLKVF